MLMCVSLCDVQAAIRKELNEFKSTEMEVHESSRHLTRWDEATLTPASYEAGKLIKHQRTNC